MEEGSNNNDTKTIGKDPNLVQSYRPISLLPILSKVFEKLFIKRLKSIIVQRELIPNHQFGFREQHGTTEQAHRVVNKISKDLENTRYCTAAFLDISQAFNKVWHDGLLYKLKQNLPHQYFQILKSYLKDRKFMVTHREECSEIMDIHSMAYHKAVS